MTDLTTTKTATFARLTEPEDGIHPGRVYDIFPPLWYAAVGVDANSVADQIVITCWDTSRGVETYAWPMREGRVASTNPLEGSINKSVADSSVFARMGYQLEEEYR